jgi:hypothetical protein
MLFRTLLSLLHAGFLLGLHFILEDGSVMLFQNDEWLSSHYMAVYPRYKNCP